MGIGQYGYKEGGSRCGGSEENRTGCLQGFGRDKKQRKRIEKSELERKIYMKYTCVVLSVSDINAARTFYEDLFVLEVDQNYGRNIAFTCGLALQQDFDWLVNIPKEKVLKKSNNAEVVFEEEDFDGFLNKLKEYPAIEYLGEVVEHSWGQRVIRFYDLDGHIIEVGEDMKMVIERFLNAGMSMEEVSVKMDVSAADLEKLLNA